VQDQVGFAVANDCCDFRDDLFVIPASREDAGRQADVPVTDVEEAH
jgi:hypothetical protein